jgi:IS5 family transposase
MEEHHWATINRVDADRDYRSHEANSTNEFKVCIATQTRRVTDTIRRELLRRPEVEFVIGNLNEDHRMSWNFLAHAAGKAINAILAAVGYKFRRCLARLKLCGNNGQML